MDNKQIMIIAAGIVVLALVVIGAAFIVLNDKGGSSATPTPGPGATSAPTGGSTASPAPSGNPTQTPGATPGPTGPIIIQANVQVNGTGICFVSMYLNKDTTPIDVSHLKMNIECDGKTYSDVMKSMDWDNSNGNSLLESKEAITTQVNTKDLGIPQGKTFTIKVLQDGAVIQEKSVTPA